MYPFRRILIPTDFSTASEWVFDDAVRFAGSTNAELVILHIRMTRSSHPSELRFPADPKLYEYAEQYELDALRNRVKHANASITTRLVVRQAPDPGEEICRVVKDENADLVVIATHARHHVAHLIIGNTTMAVITNPPAPVLAVRYGIRKRTGLKRIVLPIHPQQMSRPALDLASAIATRGSAELHLITICEAADQQRAEEHLRDVAASQSLPVKTATVRGSDVEKEVCRYIERVEADMLFLNATGEPGPVKRDIIRSVGVPVMIVPAP
ncbi:MAG TPA: universal stress protein [Thermoanaerobaculia bacterium]|nr:universal stress protein [Thermoanaerobaculia bacterium]